MVLVCILEIGFAEIILCKMIFKNKKGELTSTEITKIVLAVIGIGLLLYLSVSLYGIFLQKTKVEQAKVNLEKVFSIINDLQEEQTKKFLIESPKDWDFIFFSRKEVLPLKCNGENCLCICNEPDKETCDDKGVCRPLSEEVLFESSKGNYISLDEIPKQVFFRKVNNELIISERGV